MLQTIPVPTYGRTSASQTLAKNDMLKKIKKLVEAPLDVKINIAKYLDYGDIVFLEKTVDSCDEYRLSLHLSVPFENSLQDHLPRPYSHFTRQCDVGLSSTIIVELDTVARQRAVTCIAPECKETNLYKQLYVPWRIFSDEIIFCMYAAISHATNAQNRNQKVFFNRLDSVLDRLDGYVPYVDVYGEICSTKKVALETCISKLRAIHDAPRNSDTFSLTQVTDFFNNHFIGF